MSRRCGISMPLSSLPNEICFNASAMNHPRADERAPPSQIAHKTRPRSGAPEKPDCFVRFWCRTIRAGIKRGPAAGADVIPACCAAVPAAGDSSPATNPAAALLDFDCGALLFELGFDLIRFVLVDAGLDRLRRAVDEVLRFFQPEPGDLANDRDLGLLFDGRSRTTSAARRRRTGDRSRRDGDVELRLECLDQSGELEYRHVADRFENLVWA